MKFACGEFHLWYQVALSMVACGKVRLAVVHHPQGTLLFSGPSERWGTAGRQAGIQKCCQAADFHLQGSEGTGGPTQAPVRASSVHT